MWLFHLHSTVKIQPFFQFSLWRNLWPRYFAGDSFGVSRKRHQPFSLISLTQPCHKSLAQPVLIRGDPPPRISLPPRCNPKTASYSFILVIYLFHRRTAAVLDTDHWVGAFSQGHSTRHKSAIRPSGLHETKRGFSFLQWEQGSISKSSSCSTIKAAPHQTFLPSESARKRRSNNRP